MASPHFLAALFVLCCGCGDAGAADLSRSVNGGPQVLFAPTDPIGVASEVPRSPLTDFIVNASLRFERRDQAQARCPRDVVVWVGFGSNFYRFDDKHERDESGAYMCQGDASMEGDRPFRPEGLRVAR